MYVPTIYIVQEFLGCGFTIGHIASQRRVAEWKNLKAFTDAHQAEKFMVSLVKENKTSQYIIEEVPFHI